MESDSCRVCGGDGRIANSLGGSDKTCPSCRGSGRRSVEPLFRDVTKTKESHYRTSNMATRVEKPTWPSSSAGAALANEVRASGHSENTKAQLVREIIEYEESHGSCTKTFVRKIKKQLN